MHILYLHQYFTTPQLTGGTRSYDFARTWIERGNRVTLVTSSALLGDMYLQNKKKRINTLHIDGIHVVCISVPYSHKMTYLQRIMSFLLFMLYSSLYLLKKRDYDLVYATSTPLTIAVPALVAKARNKIPFLFEVRDLWPEYPEDFGILRSKLLVKLLESFCKFLYKKACHIVTISDSMSGRIKKKYKINENKISTIPIGACHDLLNSIILHHLHNYAIDYSIEGKFIIGYAGTIGYVNNLESMLRMAGYLKDYDDILFLVAGDGKEKDRLQREAHRLNLSNIKFIGPFNHFQITQVIETFDLAYISERPFDSRGRRLMNAQDTLSNKFFDYIALGKPVIINAEGEISKLLEEHNVGFYIDDTKEERVSEVIVKLKQDKELRNMMGTNSRNLAEAFDRSKLAEMLEDIFKKYSG